MSELRKKAARFGGDLPAVRRCSRARRTRRRARQINGMGLAGFVLSLAAVLVLALFHSAFCAVIVLPAFALSLCGTMQCRAEPREYGGKAFAVVGLVVSAILLAVYLFLFLSVSAVAVLFLPLFAVI